MFNKENINEEIRSVIEKVIIFEITKERKKEGVCLLKCCDV